MASSTQEAPRLPPELEREIFELCARTDTQIALILLRVACRVYEWILPIIYHTLVLEVQFILPRRTRRFLHAHPRTHRKAKRSKHFDLIHQLTCTKSGPSLSSLKVPKVLSLLPLCPNLTSLALHPGYWVDYFQSPDSILDQLSLKQLYLPKGGYFHSKISRTMDSSSDYIPWPNPTDMSIQFIKPLPLLTSLTHLTCSNWELSDLGGFDMSRFTSLTHLWIEEVRFWEPQWDFIKHLTYTLGSIVHSPKFRACVLRTPEYDTHAGDIREKLVKFGLIHAKILLLPQLGSDLESVSSGFECVEALPEGFWGINDTKNLWEHVENLWKWADMAVDEQKQTGRFL